MFYYVEDGVDCFEVGVQQLLDWMGWTDYHRDSFVANYTLMSYISYVNVDSYVVVECGAYFGDVMTPCICRVYRSLNDALAFACSEDEIYGACRHEYEVWHVMDDGDLWQLWEHDAELSRVDAPVLLDERDIDGICIDHEQLWSLNVPSVGRVFFLWGVRNGELVEEFLTSDWQGLQPNSLRDAFRYDWVSVEEMLAAVRAYEMLRDAGALDGGGRVGAAC